MLHATMIIIQSDPARIVAAFYTVGGYSISLRKNVPTPHLINYTMLTAFFAVALSLLRRKRK